MVLEARFEEKLVKRLRREDFDLISLFPFEKAEITKERGMRTVAYVWGINKDKLFFSTEIDDEGYLIGAKCLSLNRLESYRVLK